MRRIMQEGNLSASVSLDTLDLANLYALGPVAGLQGEIAVIDGHVYVARRKGTAVDTGSALPAAAMLVHSRVKRWLEVPLGDSTVDLAAVESAIEAAAARHGYDLEKPFAFRIEGGISGWSHIIHWESGVKHTMENHKQFALSGPIAAPMLIGFYSRHHAGVFTHHSTRLHMHVVNPATGYVGHVDELRLGANAILFLPVE
jgi:acetolactate decarboxylase